MTTQDLITRAEFIYKKYQKYSEEKNKDRLLNPGDAFSELCMDFEFQIAALLERAKAGEGERNRTALAQMNAEIRREKAKLKAQIPDLVKMSKKKARKLPPEKKQERLDKIEAIEASLDAVPDGTAPERRKRRDKLLDQAGPITLNVDTSNMTLSPMSMDHSTESTAFRQEYLQRKAKQDEGLDQISKGLRTLKDMGHAMSDELNKQAPLMDNIDSKASDATTELRTANTKLKALLSEMRQPHKLCLDLILVSVLLGIGSYIFTLAKPSTTSNAKAAASSALAKVTGGSSTTPAASGRRLMDAWAAATGGQADAWPGGAVALLNDAAVLRLLR